ncbi:MAG TPA: porin [Methylocella sp.]|nr:porin [Methylocella sp.]
MTLRVTKKALAAAVAAGALTAFDASGAMASSISDEIRSLKARLKQLEDQLARQEKQIRGVAKSPAMPQASGKPKDCKGKPCPEPEPPPPVFVSVTNGLKIESFDKAFSFKVGGRIYVDGGVNSQPIQAFPGIKPYFPAHGATGFSNQAGIRQARLQAEGTAFKWWDYKLSYDFVAAPNGLVLGGIRDAYLLWRYFDPLTFEIGNFFEPFSLARTSVILYQDFMERPLAGDLLAPSRHIGFAAGIGGKAPGLAGEPNWSLKGGIFSTSVEDGQPVAPSVTTANIGGTTAVTGFNPGIPAGSASLLAPVPGGHQYWDVSARLTYAPVLTSENLLHVGGSVRYQKPNDATAANDNRVLQPGSTLASEANIVGESLLGTQPLTCVAATAQLVGQNCVKNVLNYSVEAVASYGPFSITGEYLGMHYDRDAALITYFHAPGGTSINFSGWYAYATWYLTGESRAAAYVTYEKNPERPGTFGQIKILNPLSAGGWGAWELAARISAINLNDGSFLFLQPPGTRSNIQGGRQTDFTLGLNWYPEIGIRFMANWVNVLQYSANYTRPDLNGIHPQLFVMRAQVNW